MNLPERQRVERPPAEAAVTALAAALEAVATAAIAVEAASGAILVQNAQARQVPLPAPPGSDTPDAYYATLPDKARIAAAEMPRALASRAAGPAGLEFAWHTPERDWYFRAFARPVTAAGAGRAAVVLTLVDLGREKDCEAELKHALEVRDEFFSVATHELKDPLFSLQLSIQLLRHTAQRHGDIPAHVLHHLQVSERQTERLTRLIDNLLDVSRISNRRLHLDSEALDLTEVARDAASRFQEKARAVGSTVHVVADGPVIGYFDRLKLEQIASNLLSNALKYGAGKPITIRVAAADDRAVLEVQDDGVGIAEEDHGRIFGRFERATRDYKKDSLGLGLYIVRSLVEAHAGTVAVRSAPGRGATFTVTLPRRRLFQQDPSPESAQAGSQG